MEELTKTVKDNRAASDLAKAVRENTAAVRNKAWHTRRLMPQHSIIHSRMQVDTFGALNRIANVMEAFLMNLDTDSPSTTPGSRSTNPSVEVGTEHDPAPTPDVPQSARSAIHQSMVDAFISLLKGILGTYFLFCTLFSATLAHLCPVLDRSALFFLYLMRSHFSTVRLREIYDRHYKVQCMMSIPGFGGKKCQSATLQIHIHCRIFAKNITCLNVV